MKKNILSIIIGLSLIFSSANALIPLLGPVITALLAYDTATDVVEVVNTLNEMESEEKKTDACLEIYDNIQNYYKTEISNSSNIESIDDFAIAVGEFAKSCQMQKFLDMVNSTMDYKKSVCSRLYSGATSIYENSIKSSTGLFVNDESILRQGQNEIRAIKVSTCDNKFMFDNLVMKIDDKIAQKVHWFNIILTLLGVFIIVFFIVRKKRFWL